ncbi:group I intron-associated PD-(D/E)XK endonuclease [Bacterioplanoides sp.]|uniref:group I intron-associated PD-(D/E)XK endonuclease n=1 Tax=Bacterioplanoides sp. TaxID=2066072 RepID=UPI003B00C67B
MSTKAVQAEHLVAADLSGKGYAISFPTSDMHPFDMIATKNSETLKIQVKLLYESSFQRFSTGNDLTKYKKGDFDLLAVVFPSDYEVRYLKFDEMNGRRRLSFKQDQFTQPLI